MRLDGPLTLQLVTGLFAAFMLARNVPRVVRALRGSAGEAREPVRAVVPLINVVLALVLLTMAVKGLGRPLISK